MADYSYTISGGQIRKALYGLSENFPGYARDIFLHRCAVLVVSSATTFLLLPVLLAYPLLNDPADHAFRCTVFDADRQGAQFCSVLEVQLLFRDGAAEGMGLFLIFGFGGLIAAIEVVVLDVFHGIVVLRSLSLTESQGMFLQIRAKKIRQGTRPRRTGVHRTPMLKGRSRPSANRHASSDEYGF